MKKILTVFLRDAKVSTRDFLTLYIILVPFILAVAVNFFAPGIEDTTVNLAMINGENEAQVEYLERFAKIELYDNVEEIENRVLQRDNIIGLVGTGDNATLIAQGNEPEEVVTFAQLLKTYYEYDRQVEDSTAVIKDFGVTVPPLKMLFANMGILLTSILSGMLIALNIVEEKMDNTVSAINLAPISPQGFIIGKSLIGLIVAVIGALAMIAIMGLWGGVNSIQLVLFVFVATLLSLMIGFIEGVKSDDVMTAAAGVKMVMMPMALSIAGYEFLSAKWQWVLYWSPFYWAYKGNEAILNNTATWGQLALYAGIILVITGAVYIYLAPQIRKGLES